MRQNAKAGHPAADRHRVELHHGIVAGQPGRMRVARIQGRVFQQAQAPAMRRFRPAMTAQPVEPVVGMPAQVLPGQRERIQPQTYR
jgi:hypothetical protein